MSAIMWVIECHYPIHISLFSQWCYWEIVQEIQKIYPSGRSLSHWGHAPKGDCDTLICCFLPLLWLLKWLLALTYAPTIVLLSPMVIHFNPLNHELNKPFPYRSYFPRVFCYSNNKNLVKDDEYILDFGEDPLKPRRESQFVASDNRESLLC